MDTSWADWQIVHAAWNEGSFSAAADALGLGQATVSRRVARVEEALGTPLFTRHRSGLQPTAAAEAMRPHLEALAAAALAAHRAIDGLESEASGLVRIAAAPGVCADLMPALVLRLAQSHPRIRLEVLADIHARDLDRREADLAVRSMPTDRGDLLVRRIGSTTGGLYATPALLAGLPEGYTLPDVPLVGWSEDLAHIPIARALAAISPRPPVFATNDYLVLRAAVVAGLGATLLSSIEARGMQLQAVETGLPDFPAMPFFLVVHRALRHVPRVAVVIDAIDALAAEAFDQG